MKISDEHTGQQTVVLLPSLVTDDDVAVWLGVTPRTIWVWTRNGKFPQPVKLGKARAPKRWLTESIENWIKEQARLAA
jgi:predicted DNA-binding transcriptional regulator AlpA